MLKTILIVEDSSDSRSFLKLLLEDTGYQVLEAENGLEAVETVKQQIPDLILMDIAMPLMDGLTAAKTIRQLEGTAGLPIIAVTAFWSVYYKQAAEVSFNDLIYKPIDPIQLISVINRYLGPEIK